MTTQINKTEKHRISMVAEQASVVPSYEEVMESGQRALLEKELSIIQEISHRLRRDYYAYVALVHTDVIVFQDFNYPGGFVKLSLLPSESKERISEAFHSGGWRTEWVTDETGTRLNIAPRAQERE